MTAEAAKPRRKRPIWVWLIAIYYVLSFAWTIYSFVSIWSGKVALTPEQQYYFDNLTALDYLSTFGLGLLNVCGAVALFLLRQIALPIFVSALGISVVLVAWHSLTKGWVEAIGGAGLVGALIGYGLVIVVCLYTWRLKIKGVLR